MKRLMMISSIFFTLLAPLFAYDAGLPTIPTTSVFTPVTLEAEFQHRFYGSVTESPLDTGFGTSAGANVLVAARAALWRGLETGVSHVSGPHETTIHAGYSFSVWMLRAVARAELYTAAPVAGKRTWGGIVDASVQTAPLLGAIVPTMLVAFDIADLRFGGALGLQTRFPVSIGPIETLGASAELYPNFDLRIGDAGSGPLESPAFIASLNATTYGHQFSVILANTFAYGTRNLIRGAAGDGWYLGFVIRRMLPF